MKNEELKIKKWLKWDYRWTYHQGFMFDDPYWMLTKVTSRRNERCTKTIAKFRLKYSPETII